MTRDKAHGSDLYGPSAALFYLVPAVPSRNTLETKFSKPQQDGSATGREKIRPTQNPFHFQPVKPCISFSDFFALHRRAGRRHLFLDRLLLVLPSDSSAVLPFCSVIFSIELCALHAVIHLNIHVFLYVYSFIIPAESRVSSSVFD